MYHRDELKKEGGGCETYRRRCGVPGPLPNWRPLLRPDQGLVLRNLKRDTGDIVAWENVRFLLVDLARNRVGKR